jgi:transcriptional regulator with XRE-family HTH domain
MSAKARSRPRLPTKSRRDSTRRSAMARDSAMASLRIAGRVRHARLSRGARMKDLADAAGCSESLISKIENNKINPSLNVLHRICDALKLTFGELFAAPDDERVVARAGERVTVELDQFRRGTGLRMERLVPYAKGHLLQGNIHVVAAGGSTAGLLAHDGEEIGYVISGEIELTVGERTYRLGAGDSFCYRSEQPHGYRNVGDAEARVLFVNTPPSF